MLSKHQINKLEKLCENKNINYKKGLISVIIPIYGNFCIDRLMICIDSLKSQKENVEIIVSEQGENSRLENRLNPDIKHIFSPLKSEAEEVYSGKIRNIGIRESKGEFIYTNDADIIFPNSDYFNIIKNILTKNDKLIIHKPLMRRLIIDNFNEFSNLRENLGFSGAINKLDFNQKYITTTDKIERKLKIIKKSSDYEKIFTCSWQKFIRYSADKNLKGLEPTIWKENLHAGGNFFRKKHFELVGGYCERYSNWGREDSDLQWKLGELYNLEFFPKNENLEVIHLDHELPYFSKEKWQNNEIISHKRVELGAYNAILEDLKIFQ